MYPTDFDYYRAETLDGAVSLLAEHRAQETAVLAGAHGLVPRLKSREVTPDVVIDIGRIDALRGIDSTEYGLRIGALTPYVDIVESDAVWEQATVMAEATENIGDFQVRNMGTIGGNIAQAHPASDLPAAALAVDATIAAAGPNGERRIDPRSFFSGAFSTALDDDEIITHLEIEPQGERGAGAYAKRARQSLGYAVVGIAVSLQIDDGVIRSSRVAVNGLVDHPIRLPAVEDSLQGENVSAATLEAAAARAGEDVSADEILDDSDASSVFRHQLLRVYTKRALDSAAERDGFDTTSESELTGGE
ncbi:FAD binding domain-containing protein [Halobellus ordinarius]|uniref:FAD binding domain-containing protein n=1 Tax=Halobellus ordinarius TaxID=3075120 RepID=UPI0028804AA0|nr:xanthine dehydrogenase family protein subunit M [Halobellus sp. ZY16]